MKRVFVVLGTQKFQFNRLLIELDRLCEEGNLNGDVFAQIGYSDYRPKHFAFREFLNREDFEKEIDKADIIITHGGTGVIVNALKKRKKVIAVPRLEKYKEHVDDHQCQIIEQFRDLNLICACRDTEELAKAILTVQNTNYSVYESNTGKIIESIEEFINLTKEA